ncbi:MAG: HpcH/HpaI aldolase/citrate lyase family protein [Haliea sp.]
MNAHQNSFKQRLRAGELLDGLWLTLASPIVSEAVSLLGFDWLAFDMEHTPVDVSGLQPLLQSAAAGTASPVVRVAWNDPVTIKRVIDTGPQTILVPFVETEEDARRAVAATRYPPQGIRGVAALTRASRFGLTYDYFEVANREMCVLVQVETAAAIDQLESIATVEGVDGVFIGPSDLAASLGHLGTPSHPDVQQVLKDAVRRILKSGTAPGILATNTEDALRYRDWGYRFLAGSLDIGLVISGARELLSTMRSTAP